MLHTINKALIPSLPLPSLPLPSLLIPFIAPCNTFRLATCTAPRPSSTKQTAPLPSITQASFPSLIPGSLTPSKLSCIANNLLSGAVIHSRDKHTFSAYNVTKLASVAVPKATPKGLQLS
jgi:hypothetical protein